MIELGKTRYAGEFEIVLDDCRESGIRNRASLDILYGLSGKARIRTVRDDYVIVPEHFCVMNPMELYYIAADDNCCLPGRQFGFDCLLCTLYNPNGTKRVCHRIQRTHLSIWML